jgi:hypothetical protein
MSDITLMMCSQSSAHIFCWRTTFYSWLADSPALPGYIFIPRSIFAVDIFVVTEPLRIRVTYPLPGNGQAGTYISRRCPGIYNLSFYNFRDQLLPWLRNRCLVINNSSLLVSANMSYVPVAWQRPGWNIHIYSDISALRAECRISPCLYS